MKLWTKMNFSIIGEIKNIPKHLRHYLNRLRSILFKTRYLQQFELYSLLKEKGIHENNIQNLFHLSVSCTDYFYWIIYPYQKLREYLDEQTFYLYIFKIEKLKEIIQNTILSSSLYPIFLLFFLWIFVIFCDSSILPQLYDTLSITDVDMHSFISFRMILTFFKVFMIILCILSVYLVLRLQNKRFYKKAYLFLYHFHKNNLLSQYYSILFSYEYQILLSQGLSTQMILITLSENNPSNVLKYLSEQIQNKLLSGMNMEDSMKDIPLSDNFIMFFNIGSTSSSLKDILLRYQETEILLFKQKIKRFMNYIQYSVYFLISVMIVIMYQFFMLPLSIIQTI